MRWKTVQENHPIVRKIRALLRESHGAITLAEVARRLGRSRYECSRLFSKNAGVTFQREKVEIRLLRGCDLLASGRSISLTAFDIGYSERCCFHKAFKTHFGLTPAAYREMNRKKPQLMTHKR